MVRAGEDGSPAPEFWLMADNHIQGVRRWGAPGPVAPVLAYSRALATTAGSSTVSTRRLSMTSFPLMTTVSTSVALVT